MKKENYEWAENVILLRNYLEEFKSLKLIEKFLFYYSFDNDTSSFQN